MKVEQILSQFQATGVETCFHDRHINPQIYAGLNGRNWGIKDYEARGGYAALRKILGKDGGEGNRRGGHDPRPGDRHRQRIRPAWSRRCGFPHGPEVELHAPPVPRSKVPGVQLGRRRAGHMQRPRHHGVQPAHGDRGHDHRGLCHGHQRGLQLHPRRNLPHLRAL